jgi:ABC-type Fe3+/spermidine/putrescine transport system ATPase subunit
MALADLIVVMESGKIRQMGTPRELYKHPRTPLAPLWRGRNLLSGEVVAFRDRRATVQSLGGARFAIPIEVAQVGDKVICSIRCDKTSLAPSTVDANAFPWHNYVRRILWRLACRYTSRVAPPKTFPVAEARF